MAISTKNEAIKKAGILRKRLETLDRAFRRLYPNLIGYLDGKKDLSGLSIGYYRDKIQAHKKIISGIEKEVERLDDFSERQLELF